MGDLNSQPNSPVHDYFRKGFAYAKEVAPWYHHHQYPRKVLPEQDNLSEALQQQLSLLPNEAREPPQVRYMLDFTLNRLCRWLRILGIDAGLETEEEERMRTKDGKM